MIFHRTRKADECHQLESIHYVEPRMTLGGIVGSFPNELGAPGMLYDNGFNFTREFL